MNRLLVISCIMMFFFGLTSCESQKEDKAKYEIAADRAISGPYMKAHKAGEQIQLEEMYPLEDSHVSQKMQMDSPDEKMDKAARIRFHKNDEIMSFPDEVQPDR